MRDAGYELADRRKPFAVDEAAPQPELFGDVALHLHVVRHLPLIVRQRHNRARRLERGAVAAPMDDGAVPRLTLRHLLDFFEHRERLVRDNRRA